MSASEDLIFDCRPLKVPIFTIVQSGNLRVMIVPLVPHVPTRCFLQTPGRLFKSPCSGACFCLRVVDTVLLSTVELVSELLPVRVRVRFAFSKVGIVSTTKRRLSVEESEPLRARFASWKAGIVSIKRRLGSEDFYSTFDGS
jgi:hypothetical protein